MIDALGGVRSVLLLGGASEIGVAILHSLDLPPGAQVVLAGRHREALSIVAAGLPAGVRAAVVEWDAAGGAAAARAVVAAAVDAVGDVDLVVAAAGVLGDQTAADATVEDAVRVLEVNFVGVAAACLRAAQRLREQGHGTLVVLSSVAALRPRRSTFVYGSSKAGLDAFATGLADALVGSGARVVVVRPGFVRGRMTEGLAPAPFATTPGAVGAAVATAVRTGAAEVHVPAVLGPLFAGLRLAPRPLWRRISARA